MYNTCICIIVYITHLRAILDSDFREMVLKIESKKEKKLYKRDKHVSWIN